MESTRSPTARTLPIGVFDSGVGGLTVLHALAEELPQERFVYLGDTARLPYGTKSPATVVRYALQAAEVLLERGVKALVVACNTASAVALPAMRERCGTLPVLGVVEPGADAAVSASASGRIAVIGTEATVRGGAYQRAIAARCPSAQVRALACQLFVALAEEGWTDGAVARAAAESYLRPLFGGAAAGADLRGEAGSAASPPDTLVLGCTHFPMLLHVIREVVGEHVEIVDSAATTARAAHALLRSQQLLLSRAARPSGPATRLRFLATDGAERFASIGARFLGCEIVPEVVEIVDL